MIICKICQKEISPLFLGTVLGKYDVQYYKCNICGFIQTMEPYWLEEAYSNAIATTDVGLLSRNLFLKDTIPPIINKNFNPYSKFIDYGGGYGVFVRIMRDLGYDYYRQDAYCENIFAQHFDITNQPITKYELLTAFEVFEHLKNPIEEITKMLELSDSILFSTEAIPSDNIKTIDDWWYFTPQTGQHIALYSIKSLEHIAQQLGCSFYTNGINLHLLSKQKLYSPFKTNVWQKSIRLLLRILQKINTPKKLQSKLWNDYLFITTSYQQSFTV